MRLHPQVAEKKDIAQWEKHTRGIGSKLLASMGYKVGQPLGAKLYGADGTSQRAEALREPIEIRVLPKVRAQTHSPPVQFW